MRKIFKRILMTLAVLLLIYFSLDLENLQEYNAGLSTREFNVSEFVNDLWEEDLPQAIREAPDLNEICRSLEENPEEAFIRYGRKLGISGTGYFFMKGQGVIETVEEEYIVVSGEGGRMLRLATEYIFGNAVRDGSGKVDINAFVNMTDFNSTSVEINRRIKERVVPRLVKIAQPGKTIEFAGATEIVEDRVNLDSLLVIPVQVNIVNGGTN